MVHLFLYDTTSRVWQRSALCAEAAEELARRERPVIAEQRKLRRANAREWAKHDLYIREAECACAATPKGDLIREKLRAEVIADRDGGPKAKRLTRRVEAVLMRLGEPVTVHRVLKELADEDRHRTRVTTALRRLVSARRATCIEQPLTLSLYQIA